MFFPPALNPILRVCLGPQIICIVTIPSDPELVKEL